MQHTPTKHMSNNNDRIIKKIKELEDQLKELRLELTKENKTPDDNLKIGDRVRIVNPTRGQPANGELVKINRLTNRGTVLAKEEGGREQKVVRKLSNLKKHQDDDE